MRKVPMYIAIVSISTWRMMRTASLPLWPNHKIRSWACGCSWCTPQKCFEQPDGRRYV